jgi:hypothetical protein
MFCFVCNHVSFVNAIEAKTHTESDDRRTRRSTSNKHFHTPENCSLNPPEQLIESLDVGVNERAERANASVDTRLTSLSTAITPGDKTNEGLGRVDNGASRVTLARVLATSSNTGTEHGVSDLADGVVVAASGAGDDGHVDLAQGGGRGSALSQSSPAGNGGGTAGGRVGTRGCEGSVADGAAGRDASGELPDGDVVGKSRAREAGVNLDRGDADEGSARVAVLVVVSMSSVKAGFELTYQASSADREGRSGLANGAVSGGDDRVGVKEGATTEVGAAALQRDDEGEFASLSSCATDNVHTLRLEVLRSRSSGDCGGQEASDHCLVLHLDEVLGSEGSECWKRISEWMILWRRRSPPAL